MKQNNEKSCLFRYFCWLYLIAVVAFVKDFSLFDLYLNSFAYSWIE